MGKNSDPFVGFIVLKSCEYGCNSFEFSWFEIFWESSGLRGVSAGFLAESRRIGGEEEPDAMLPYSDAILAGNSLSRDEFQLFFVLKFSS